jgi:putative DNA primase/helicase
MGERARILAGKGLAVFPCFTIEEGRCSCGAPSCASPGKHPIGSLVPQGVLNATTDPQLVREWWALYPDANVGIATGDASGVVVLDVDADTGGEQTLANLEARFERLPDTWAVLSGGGGAHFYFRMPGSDVRNSAGSVGPGIDVRGNGGYVIAPPSLHKSGAIYRWSTALHPKDVPLADVPAWLLDRMVPKGMAAGAAPLPAAIKEGMRNTWLASAAGTMRRRGFCEDAIAAALLIENRHRCVPPLDDREVRRIARSIDRYKPEPELRTRFNRAA